MANFSNLHKLRLRVYKIIFHTDTRAGKIFDEILLGVILLSVALVMLDSVSAIRQNYLPILFTLEWIITALFTIEYALRIWSSGNRLKYIFSFYGIIDLMAIVPTFLVLFVAGTQYLSIVRALRLLRIFRILKLTHYSTAGAAIIEALLRSRKRIVVFLFAIFIVVIIIGSAMYVIEGPQYGFTSIPRSAYWAIVTLTTVGYGDISPHTAVGQFLASCIMVLGYSIIAVPTSIISTEMVKKDFSTSKFCSHCKSRDLDADSKFCKNCGKPLQDA